MHVFEDERPTVRSRPERPSTAEMSRVPRPMSSLVGFWAVAIFAALLVGDTLVGLHWVAFFTWLAPAALVVWLLWLLLYRPIILFDTTRVVTINPFRIIEAPWAHVTAVRQRLQIMLDLDDGKTVTCWASPFPEKPGRRRPSSFGTRGGEPSRVDFARPLESMRIGALASAVDRKEQQPITRRWDWVAIGIGGLLIVACAIEFAIVH